MRKLLERVDFLAPKTRGSHGAHDALRVWVGEHLETS
jgi:hypothetical protein